MTIRRGRASPAAKLAVVAWTVFRLPLDLSQFSFASYRQAFYGGMANSFLNSLAVTLPAVAIPCWPSAAGCS